MSNSMAWNFEADFRVLAQAVEFRSPTVYLLAGEPRDFSQLRPDANGQSAPPPFMLQTLESELYARYYCRPDTTFVMGAAGNVAVWRDHVLALSRANSGTGTWEPGWRIVSVERDDRLAVAKDSVNFWVERSMVRTHSQTVRVGTFCRVRIGKEMQNLVPGFYMAIGDGDPRDSRDEPGDLVRIYWNLGSDAAVRYIELITRYLNESKTPFRTKVVSDPQGYGRADAAVLYFERKDVGAVETAARKVYRALGGLLGRSRPMFTKYLADGVGLAEDPADGLSFGQSRSRLVAQALWQSFERGKTAESDKCAAMVAAFHAKGWDPERPYLRGRLSADYEMEITS